MGRLNYSARRIFGVKAGQVISKDLKKRIPPALNSKAAGRDPTLEIDVSNKRLTDEGFSLWIDDLIECIKYRDDDHVAGLARVVELHVRGNELTVHSLAKLGEVVALCKGDLHELDVSNNNIEVKTPTEKQIWFEFLSSFKDCYMLRKLDLGANPLGHAGVEILARVYIKSDLDFLEDDAEDIIDNAAEEIEVLAKNMAALKVKPGKENESPKGSGQKKSPNKGKSAKATGPSQVPLPKEKIHAKLKHFACTRGLRSIPYLIVCETFLTAGSTVHLSSMLEIQRTPDQLLEFLPTTAKTLALPEEAKECKGIIWLPNYDLGDIAYQLLYLSESIHDLKDMSDPEEADDEADDEDDTQSSSDQPAARKMGTLEMRKMQSKRGVDLSRLNKRVRMEALKKEGVHSFDIWITALRMMLVSRALLLEDMDRPCDTPVEEEVDTQVEHEEPEKPAPEPPKRVIHDLSEDARVEQLRNLPHPPQDVSRINPGPFFPGTEEFFANFPALRPVPIIQIDTAEDGSNSEATNDSETAANKDGFSSTGGPGHRSGKPNARFIAAREPEKTQWRYGLPLALWRRIIADAVGANQVLDEEQQERIMRYASDWKALGYEMTITGAEDHQQIWKFLETVHCFTYSCL
ncbi:hypothetical protein P170DRAFT_445518 [Aspergillus steynii IBT 23096]|uniref:Leucine rich repeat protein n=1 Tax=Aspergillus steynii IBT 23096 TaxID=1392250 RepID=A0A2I2GB83_9EURO|nr:uncharacterized protein P170DRAFT_445518 [Aspergillus steynii IBT 23096]PLB50143.1 hypothetical protein P170DRAFT_445518 [Aspergillus steynii IBT 23096]